MGQGPVVPLAGSYGPHPITEPLRNIATFFKLARSVTPAKPPVPDITAESLVLTSERSWAETDLKSVTNNAMAPDPKADVLGPISLAVVATRNGPPKPPEAGKEAKEGETPSKGRMVVFGDSDFAANSSYGQLLNGDLFNNSVSWLTHDESFISIRAKDPTNREVNMTQSEQRTWGVIAIIAIPGAILLIGASVWASRRK